MDERGIENMNRNRRKEKDGEQDREVGGWEGRGRDIKFRKNNDGEKQAKHVMEKGIQGTTCGTEGIR